MEVPAHGPQVPKPPRRSDGAANRTSQRTYIKPFYTANEQYGSVLPIEVNNSILPLGPVYVKKIVLPSNNLE